MPHDLAQFCPVHDETVGLEAKLLDGQHCATLTVPDREELPPAGHVVHFALPVLFSYVPTGQAVHCAGPVASLYFPAAHAAHVPLSGPVYPTLQVVTHEEIDVLAIAEVDHGGQDTQTVAPVVVRYVAIGQSLHTDAPVVA